MGRDEKGLFYGVNLRGENFLILRARLGGKNEPISELQREEISIPTDVMAASSKVVFVLQSGRGFVVRLINYFFWVSIMVVAWGWRRSINVIIKTPYPQPHISTALPKVQGDIDHTTRTLDALTTQTTKELAIYY